MKVNIYCFADLAAKGGCNYRQPTHVDLAPNAVVADLLSHMGTNEDAVRLVFVNGRRADLDDSLNSGDRVGLFPAVAGM